MLECPIDYFEDNLIFGVDKSCWAVFELKGFDYDMLSDESKIAILNRLTLFISNLVEAKFMIIPVSQDLDAAFKGLINNLQKNYMRVRYIKQMLLKNILKICLTIMVSAMITKLSLQ